MKQKITEQQLNELSQKGKMGYYGWVSTQVNINREWDYLVVTQPYLVNIGQMIEFLDEDEYFDHEYEGIMKEDEKWGVRYHGYGDAMVMHREEELCDLLWKAVKEILEF
jgi:hypothetical protein